MDATPTESKNGLTDLRIFRICSVAFVRVNSPLASLLHPGTAIAGNGRGSTVADLLGVLHRLTFDCGSEALDFVRSLRESDETRVRDDLAELGPILVYGERILAPDAPAELYVSIGALTLAHALGMPPAKRRPNDSPASVQLPADLALLFTARIMPDERGGLSAAPGP